MQNYKILILHTSLKATDQHTTDVAMLRNRDHQAEDYFNERFRYSESISKYISKERFDALQRQFRPQYDDFYHGYFEKNGDALAANKAIIRSNFRLFQSTHGHLPLAYKNCAISSGTWAHLDAATRNHHTTDRLSRVVGGDWHGRTIKDNSQRSLERIELMRDLFIEVFFIAPTMYEGSTRAFSKGQGRQLTSLPFQAEEYMAFWNMIIDSCEAFVLDDVKLDMPTKEQLSREIDLAKAYSSQSRERPILRTSDWANSRNSILEMARGNYIRFGMHPLRPDAQMDMRIYDEETGKLYPARLIDTLKPVLQSILRWGPQGIALDSACTTAARLIDLHRMRTDNVYNERKIAPLDLSRLPSLISKPKRDELNEFGILIDKFEPVLLQYFPHLIKVDGLPADYKLAQDRHAVQPSDIGERTVKWQRENIPKQEMLNLWDITLPTPYKRTQACKVKSIAHGTYVPQRRQHDFENQPFQVDASEIWPDAPFDKLDPMFQQLAKVHMGVLEIVAQNSNVPEYAGVFRDLKRGDVALSAAKGMGLADLSLLPGALGRNFSSQVRDVNLQQAIDDLNECRQSIIQNKEIAVPAFGTPILAEATRSLHKERPHFNGPGAMAAPSDYRLAMSMEMIRRNLTLVRLSKNWETSEDESRLMMLVTKMEFGKVIRPAGNNTEIKVLNEEGQVVPFAERIERLYTYLSRLKQDPDIKRCLDHRDASALEGYGVRFISLTLARMIEIYDCLKDQEYNAGRFEVRRVENLKEFSKKLNSITTMRTQAIDEIEGEWCWLWSEDDLSGLRQEYKDQWLSIYGRQAQLAGAEPNQDIGLRQSFAPR